MAKAYGAPQIYTLGSVSELTEQTGIIDKCGGSADAAFPTLLENRFNVDCDDPNSPDIPIP